ncbi:glyoxalase superfamily protein [Vibrio europaeus]|uniref:glyoxalase superfamily protein n=1 Tax=Vibrio europaeus TaxID=300876 RepID=UPI00233F6D0A|nr:glyoxalase superfamily protein [Vibrio europaeus]MDC5806737.1 glyoxalase superfamily protein [Vibrio europaeus]MDC5827262.1 glyoxalase superfamily protein [Vibrio europaeus]MDC5830106.1 glyoxalase superfamily protein [Vibrio europaeus]MDC5836962.1 glyoxalase superfamily protein [Vibrio europaeus]
MNFQTIPIIIIFDIQKAKEFYLDYLGMNLDWEHRFEEGFPLYMQVSKGNLVFHLSEHSGDGTPGSKLFVNVDKIQQLFSELEQKDYMYCNPALESVPWGVECFTITDPFSNRILFSGKQNT